jgi:hypothetical protein
MADNHGPDDVDPFRTARDEANATTDSDRRAGSGPGLTWLKNVALATRAALRVA